LMFYFCHIETNTFCTFDRGSEFQSGTPWEQSLPHTQTFKYVYAYSY
jgi:hypothetical protein